MTYKNLQIDEERLREIVKNTNSKAHAFLTYFEKRSTKKQMLAFYNKIQHLNIDTKHWKMGGLRDIQRTKVYKYNDEDIFCENSKTSIINVKRRLKNILPHYCAICKLPEIWLNKPITLHVDHINGKRTDNRLENLRYLCPNCHQQTETWGTKNFKRKIPSPEELFNLSKTKTYSQLAIMYNVHPSHISKTINIWKSK